MLVLFCISLLIGARLFHIVHVSLGVIAIVAVVYGLIGMAIIGGKRSVLLGLALTMSVMLGALRLWMLPVPEVPLGKQALIGVVKSVDERLDKTLLKVKVDDSEVNIQVTIRDKQLLLPGDQVSVRGSVELPSDFVTDTGRTFDYDAYLSSKGVDAVVNRAQVVKGEAGSWSLVRTATSIRAWIANVLGRYITFPVDGIVAGMLVGFQGGIPKYLSDIFRDTGTLHTLVLSGYNITVLGGFLGLLMRRLPFRLKTILIIIGIVTLVLVSGAGVAAVRAGIMGSIALVAGMSLQQYRVLRSLMLAFVFFFLISPVTVFVDPGFHLSFLATLFIIVFLPALGKRLTWIPMMGKINLRELLILAVGLPLFMLPYTMYFSGMFPLVSPLANIILVPIIPMLMLGGLITVVFSWLSPLASLIGMVTSFIGRIAVAVLEWCASLPQWSTPPLPGWCVTFFYFLLFGIFFRKQIVTYLGHLRSMFRPQTSSH